MSSHEATVHHVARAPADAVFIGRPSRWGNPFVIGRDGDRETVIGRYRAWLWREVGAGRITLDELAALHSRALACSCAPRPCHGHVLSAAAAWATEQLAAA